MKKGLRPVHHSLRGRSPRPHGMSVISLDRDHIEFVEGLVLDIFTDMSNAGSTLPQTLTAVYLSGLKHAMAMLAASPPPPEGER